jgi:hypothetical protein
MSGKYILEGHKPKKDLEDEDTVAFDARAFPTLAKATAKAKELLEKDQTLGLTVIYEEAPDGTREGIKFIFRNEDGTFEDAPLFWGGGDCQYEG